MKSIGIVLLLTATTAFAYDSVIFSFTTKITKDSPSLSTLVSSASADSPLIFFVNPYFVLGQFSKAAATYSTQASTSSIVNAAKSAKYATSRFISTVHVPSFSSVSESSSFVADQAIYVVSADNWSALDTLAGEIWALLEGKQATVVVTNADAVSDEPVRVKRVSVGDEPVDKLPVVLPKDLSQTCLFYLEGLNFVYKVDNSYLYAQVRDDGEATSTKGYGGSATCNEHTATFQVTLSPKEPNAELDSGWTSISDVDLTLTFAEDDAGYWSLTGAKLNQDVIVDFKDTEKNVEQRATAKAGDADSKSLEYLGLNSVFGYGWNCWDSQALFFDKVGIAFHGIQVHIYGVDVEDTKMTYFTRQTDSCTGTFSIGSWMGIVTTIVLMAVFLFGFLMLNSVQTGDRYDDPKQKQILINVRE